MGTVAHYPELQSYLDETDDYDTTVSEVNVNGLRLLVVTQSGEFDGGQSTFQIDEDGIRPLETDTLVDIARPSHAVAAALDRRSCQRSSDADHRAVEETMVAAVNTFSSKSGPDGGNLACVWALRHIVHSCLGRWITRTDGTAVLDDELRRCYGAGREEADTPAGGIIISPTMSRNGRRNIGHVGLLGPAGGGTERRIYSNSSSRARWEQNFTLGSWIARYRDSKGLPVRFYPLPLYE